MKKIVAVLLTLTLSLGVVTPVFAQTNEIEKEKQLNVQIMSTEEITPQPRVMFEVVALILALHGGGYTGGYALGEYAYNHGYARNGAFRNSIGGIATLCGVTIGVAFFTGFDNGYVAASKA